MVEYRVLSSAMMNNVANLKFVWRQLSKAIEALNCCGSLPSSDYVIAAINNSNVELAKKIVEEYNIM